MVVQQLVSTKIPPDWVDHLDKLVVTKKLSRSALVKVAIGQYLGLSEVDPAIVTVDLRSELDDIRARLEALERSTKPSTISSTNVSTPSSTNVSTPKSKTSTPKPTASTPPIAGGLLTMSQLSKALTDLGHQHKLKNLSSRINASAKNQQLPSDLVALGVRADWDAQTQANKYSNQRRWLSLVQILEPESLIL